MLGLCREMKHHKLDIKDLDIVKDIIRIMSLDQLRVLDGFKFFLREVSDDVMLSAVPFVVKPEGVVFNMHMLRDLDFSFLMKEGDNRKFQLIAVKKYEDDKGKDTLNRAFKVIKSDRLGVSDEVYKVVEWRMKCDNIKDFGKDNKSWVAHSGFQTKFWIHWMANRQGWYCANPDIQIRTSKLVDVLVE